LLLQLKLLMIPVAGAVIGGALAGPVGLIAGLKVGKIAAVGGGIIGWLLTAPCISGSYCYY
jgi:hypothetical protein